MEEIMRALGEGLKEYGYTVDAYRDGDDLPFVLEIGKPGLPCDPALAKLGVRQPRTLVLAEIPDEPGKLEVCTEHEDLNNLCEVELANPKSIDEILQILEDYLVDDAPQRGPGGDPPQ